MPSPAERFLADFHARHAGATSVALGNIPVTCEGRPFASSYDALAARVPADASSLLDLACGDGYLLERIAALLPGARLTGIDMSAAELAAAGSRLQGRAALHEGRAQELPFADASFDAVTCHMAMMLMDDAPAVLAEVRRVLRPGGVLAAVVGGRSPASPAMDRYLQLLRPLLKASPDVVPLGDSRWRQAGEAHGLLEAAGFDEVAETTLEGRVQLPANAMWDWLLLMYDAHFLDAATRDGLRAGFLDGMDAELTVPLAWRLVTARAAPRC